jgi:hypothetical protein
MTEQGLDPSEDRPVEGRDWSKSKVPSAGLIWTRPSFRVNGWGREEGPHWVVKRTTEFFVRDTRKLGRERREQHV